AILFLRTSRKGVFQQPRLIATAVPGNRKSRTRFAYVLLRGTPCAEGACVQRGWAEEPRERRGYVFHSGTYAGGNPRSRSAHNVQRLTSFVDVSFVHTSRVGTEELPSRFLGSLSSGTPIKSG